MTADDSNKALDSARGVVAGTGLAALDRIYGTGRDQAVEALGGSCANVLVSLAMLGHRAAPLLALGEDRPGDLLLDELGRAGCETRWVVRSQERHSPVIVEYLDLDRARHSFSFRCPETSADLPRWRSIDEDQVSSADGVLREASVFYADRLSPAIVTAMEAASEAGALVFFEPAMTGDEALLARALRTVSILKLSDETMSGIPPEAAAAVRSSMVVIRTHGARGLTVAYRGTESLFPAEPAPRLVDTCGSGDMVTTGLLDVLLRCRTSGGGWSASDIHDGVRAGQRLAALNCAFAGARGLFLALGASNVRSGLDRDFEDDFITFALTFGPCDGY
ncbi:PfkB family carbohydrate kinase [Amaricoccus sp.]|uniref:PfkB family carbohydrate kinase n=1 Tax=Amaricoccus sp. TaxID=1872485 RepID=UPI002C9DD4EA|nr:PfkB family carbohydrate kinase [Amaricoccus sp.]HMQ95127.1 PfkB family carbohydrate kinase [Amaricoccus sp.]